MEKVGSLGMDLLKTYEQITTKVRDIILYQGNALVIYYTPLRFIDSHKLLVI